ncbi:MAG: hypothetical protein BWZ07_00014 [Alphaproteobacteria bacterium ADurb.BinA280]|nr:MAG: hypothetical protein BWZ07_00014 [Alphaproteobacteria bacterium ADurb.BinA280]
MLPIRSQRQVRCAQQPGVYRHPAARSDQFSNPSANSDVSKNAGPPTKRMASLSGR